MADDVYHVTFTKNLPDIQESGFDTSVKPLWAKGDPRYEGVLPPARTAYQESPSVFAFTNLKMPCLGRGVWMKRLGAKISP